MPGQIQALLDLMESHRLDDGHGVLLAVSDALLQSEIDFTESNRHRTRAERFPRRLKGPGPGHSQSEAIEIIRMTNRHIRRKVPRTIRPGIDNAHVILAKEFVPFRSHRVTTRILKHVIKVT